MNSRLFLKTKPWEKDRYEVIREPEKQHPRGNPNLSVAPYRSVYDTDIDYEKTYWKLGDVVRFGSAYHDYLLKKSWKYWYYKKEDMDAHIKENCLRHEKTPLYAAHEYAIILSRYKWIKYKWHGIYRDYGSVIMMLTGSRPGYIRRFYACSPWNKIDTYPYRYDSTKVLFYETPIGADVKNFLERLMRKFGNENQ
jgi:hypothetical protein